MKVTHYIAARQTGKSKLAGELFYEYDGPNTYLITVNGSCRSMLSDRFNIPRNKFLTNSPEAFRAREIQTLIIDDYLMGVKNKVLFINTLWPCFRNGEGNLFLISTPDRKYTYDEIFEKSYLYLLAQNNVEVIHTIKSPEQYGFRRIYPNNLEHHRSRFLTQDQFDCEMLGLYLVGQTFGWSIAKPKPFILKSLG